MCVSAQKQFAEQENNKIERGNPTKHQLRWYAYFKQLECVSRDIDPLPEDTVGPTDVRRSILKKDGRKILEDRSQTAVVTTAEHLCNSDEKELLSRIIQKETLTSEAHAL